MISRLSAYHFSASLGCHQALMAALNAFAYSQNSPLFSFLCVFMGWFFMAIPLNRENGKIDADFTFCHFPHCHGM
jgi:hypothetical protein